MLALVGACGGGGQEIVTTNSGGVVLNDAQANMTFTNDEPANATAGRPMAANEAAMMNESNAIATATATGNSM
jgi:hypothetical protein